MYVTVICMKCEAIKLEERYICFLFVDVPDLEIQFLHFIPTPGVDLVYTYNNTDLPLHQQIHITKII